MADKTVAQKLLIKNGNTVLVVNPPKDAVSLLDPLPEGASLARHSAAADVILLFATSRKALTEHLEKVKSRTTSQGLLWVVYPKLTSKLKGDIHRDSINAYAQTIGLQGVAMIAIDEEWSALRLKRVHEE